VSVVERAPGLRPGGQAVDARGVAREVIGRMGLDAAVRAACTETAGARMVDAGGNVLQAFSAGGEGGDGYVSEIEILRGDLSRVLHDDTRDGAGYVFGDQVAELAQDADGVDVAFAGGGRRRFGLVAGAGGLHSSLRAMVFGPGERFVRHLGHVLAFCSVPDGFGLGRWMIGYREPGSGRSALLRPVRDAARGMAMFSFPPAGFDAGCRDAAARKRLLRERTAGLGRLAPRILAHLGDTPGFYLDQVAQVVMDRWPSGRAGLPGDAAFSSSPLSGGGTALALAGACLLAGELAAAGWNPEAGLAGYEARMRPLVAASQETGRLHAQPRRSRAGRRAGTRARRVARRADRACGQRRRAARLRGGAGLRGRGASAARLTSGPPRARREGRPRDACAPPGPGSSMIKGGPRPPGREPRIRLAGPARTGLHRAGAPPLLHRGLSHTRRKSGAPHAAV
jgi:2-polyprenyl-6-methoxyphenol hydroxylase-like FAD-dependent oxidoreductase